MQGPANIPPFQPQGIDPQLLFLLMQQKQAQAAQQPQAPQTGMADVAKGLADAYAKKEAGQNILQGIGSALGGGGAAAGAAEASGVGAAGAAGMSAPTIATPQGLTATRIAATPGAGSIAAYIPPALAVAYGAKTAADFFKGDKLSNVQKAAMALPTAGLSLFSDSLQKKLGLVSDKYKTEQKRMGALKNKGINVPDALYNPLSKGRSKDELVAIEEQKLANGQYGNPTFARSRNVADLKPEDTWGYSAWLEKFGNDYLGKWSEDQRRNANQEALNRGLVKEHHGTIDLKADPEFDRYIQEMLGGAPAKKDTPAPAKPLDKPISNQMTKLTPEQQAQVEEKFNIQNVGSSISKLPMDKIYQQIRNMKGVR